jgi:two-component system, chemotaxis family, sensor kinase CheA
VQASELTVAIPLDAVRRTLRVRQDELAVAPEGQRLVFDGQPIPFRPLAQAIGLSQPTVDPHATWSTVIVQAGSALAAFGADRLVGTTQAVLRPLTRYAPSHRSVGGASLDAEGRPQLVLDPEGLVSSALADERVRPALGAPRRPPPVLVIDDSLTTRMLEQGILESAGYEVELACSAEEALEMAQGRRYSLFLVDVEMPGMDGFSFVARTRSDPVLRDTPAILVTSRDSPEDRLRGEQVGASAYMVKSEFDQVALLGRMKALTG